MGDEARYRFGRYELDAGNAELARDGLPLKLPPQQFTVLHLLVSHAGRLVTRQQLRDAIWGAESFVDFNAGLNFCMAQLRAVLEDPASQSRLIVTVPRRGYKFVGDVTVLPAAPDSESASATNDHRHTLRFLAITTVAVSVLTGALFVSRGTRNAGLAARPLEALQKYERGISGLGDAAPSELLARVGYFERALALDAAFAEALAGLAEAKLIIGNYRAEPPQIAYATAKAAAMKALALDDRLAEAHTAYGAAVLFFEWDWKAADEHLERAVTLGPSSARVQYWYSRYRSAQGDHQRAIAHARTAVTLDPTSPSVLTQLGMASFYAGRLDEARAHCRHALELMREFQPAASCIAAADVEATPSTAAGFWTERLQRLEQVRSEQERSIARSRSRARWCTQANVRARWSCSSRRRTAGWTC